VAYLNGSKVLTTGTALVFDGTNLGLGVTPSAWSQGKAFEVLQAGYGLWNGTSSSYILANAYYNGGFKYGSAAQASHYYQYQGQHVWSNAPSGTAGNTITFTQAMTLDASGNLGIGTSSPSAKLDVVLSQNGATRARVNNQNTGASAVAGLDLEAYGGGWTIDVPASSTFVNPLNFNFNGSTTMMQLSSTGNLGLGVTPSTFSVGKAFEVGQLGNALFGATASQLNLMQNATYNGGFKYVNAAAATYYQQLAGSHNWQISTGAPSAGGTITFTQAMTLDASGNLLVGTTSQDGRLTVRLDSTSLAPVSIINAAASGTFIKFAGNGNPQGSITWSGSVTSYNTSSDQRLKENIEDAASASSLIDSLQVRQYDWKSDGLHQRYGFVAQELVTVAPEAVHQPADPEEMMAVDYSKLVPMLVKEIQSLRKRLAAAGI
jgi:hypothetical protein